MREKYCITLRMNVHLTVSKITNRIVLLLYSIIITMFCSVLAFFRNNTVRTRLWETQFWKSACFVSYWQGCYFPGQPEKFLKLVHIFAE